MDLRRMNYVLNLGYNITWNVAINIDHLEMLKTG
jgi:hypothetical protein